MTNELLIQLETDVKNGLSLSSYEEFILDEDGKELLMDCAFSTTPEMQPALFKNLCVSLGFVEVRGSRGEAFEDSNGVEVVLTTKGTATFSLTDRVKLDAGVDFIRTRAKRCMNNIHETANTFLRSATLNAA